MLKAIKDKIGTIRTNLTRLGENQPLSKAALVIIIFLDIFIFVSIFNGLGAHTRQLTSPDEYVPATCRQIVIESNWNQASRLDNLAAIILWYSTSYYRIEEQKDDVHPLCGVYTGPIDTIRDDAELVRTIETRKKYQGEFRDIRSEIAVMKGSYDTYLLERIAKQQEARAAVNTLRKNIRQKTTALNALGARLAVLEATLNRHEAVRRLWEQIQALQEQDRQQLKDDLRTLNFWFPLKKLAMQLLFLIPLFVVFYLWNSLSIRKNRGLQTLLSSHLLIIAFIPIFLKIVETVYDIIPKKILKKIIDFLISLNLVAIWHYLTIGLSILAALALIYVFQKKLFPRERLIERRIAKGLCQDCGKKLPSGAKACPNCGFLQYKTCSTCNKPTYVFSRHCMECGSPQP